MSEELLNEQTNVQEEVNAAKEILEQSMHAETDPVVSAKALMNVGAHLGHKVSRWNPKCSKFIYGKKSGLHIIDISKTVPLLQDAYLALRSIVANNGKVLFIGTKPCAVDIVKEEANRCGSFYANTRWLGGTLTNFKTISKRIRLLKTLEEENEQGLFEKLSKKEQNEKLKVLTRLKNNLDGIKEMKKLPQAVVVVDPKWEHNAVAEARKLNIPVFGMLDTNSDPDLVDFAIPANDDSAQSVRLVLGILADAVAEAKGGSCLYAFQDSEAVAKTMSELIKEQDKIEETKAVRSKLKDDSVAVRSKENKKVIRKEYEKKLNWLAAQKAAEEAQKLAEPATETKATEEATTEAK